MRKKIYERCEIMFRGQEVPERIKKTAMAIMFRFSITGLCDGMYICNAIASISNSGNGCGYFYTDEIKSIPDVARFIRAAYGCNISEEEIPELEEILETGRLNIEKTKNGLYKYISTCRSEQDNPSCESWRKEYLEKCIMEAKNFLEMLYEREKEICEGDCVEISGDAESLGIQDYRVRVSSLAIVTLAGDDEMILVSIDEIDGDHNVCATVQKKYVKLVEMCM